MSTNLDAELIAEFGKLSSDQQVRVLAMVRAIAAAMPGTPGGQLMRFSGVLTDQEAQAMEDAIAEGCEKVNEHEW
jgi:hypothetical protein